MPNSVLMVQHGEFCGCLLQGNAWRQASKHDQQRAELRDVLGWPRHPHVDYRKGKLEISRHNANDEVRRAGQDNRASKDPRVAAETTLPEARADQRSARSFGFVFLGEEAAPQKRIDAQNVQEI